MKKMSIIISLLVGVLVLVFTAEPCLSQAVKEEFSGYRVRISSQLPGSITYFACHQYIDNQTAQWQVVVGNPLVDGYWYNYDTKSHLMIDEYTMPGNTTIPCDPSEDPPVGFTGIVMGGGSRVFGPFTLEPGKLPDRTGGGNGIWEGMWSIQYNPEGDRLFTAEAKGHGGSLEGKSLHISSIQLSPILKWCPCLGCPVSGTGTMCFEGWILTPASFK